MLAENGIQHVRTHVDVTDPTLAALKAMLEVREEARHLIDLSRQAAEQLGMLRSGTAKVRVQGMND